MKLAYALAAAAGAVLAIVPAQADPLRFVVSGDYSATFMLDSNPVPSAFDAGYFKIAGVPGFPDSWTGLADLYFYAAPDGGMAIDGAPGQGALLNTTGPVIFGGTTANPIFAPGMFELVEFSGTHHYLLTISEVAPGVPEPLGWGLMIGGFALAGGALRGRTRVRISYAA